MSDDASKLKMDDEFLRAHFARTIANSSLIETLLFMVLAQYGEPHRQVMLSALRGKPKPLQLPIQLHDAVAEFYADTQVQAAEIHAEMVSRVEQRVARQQNGEQS